MATNPKPRKTKSKSKPKKPVKRRATRVTNQNTVRVHVINSVGGDSAPPPPYSGPDRGYFAFNPVFDLGGPKQNIDPPMNTGPSISSAPVKRPTEMSTQTQPEGIFEDFVSRTNPSVGDMVEADAGPSSQIPLDSKIETMKVSEMRKVLRDRGFPSRLVKNMRKNELIVALREN